MAEFMVIESVKSDIQLWDLAVDLKKAGRYLITIEASDLAGNIAHHISSLYVDIEKPIIVPIVPGILNATGITVGFHVTVNDGNGSGFKGSILEYMVQPPEGRWVQYRELGDVSFEDILIWLNLENDASIVFKISDRAGNIAISEIKVLDLNEPPIPRITEPLDGSEVQAGRPTILDGSRSIEPENQDLTYSWVLNGDPMGLNEPVVENTLKPGPYTLVLQVSDGYSTVETGPVHFTVLEYSPTTWTGFYVVWVIIILVVIGMISIVLVWWRHK